MQTDMRTCTAHVKIDMQTCHKTITADVAHRENKISVEMRDVALLKERVTSTSGRKNE